ncbi:MAG: class I SAM-dependent methyltransferase [Deltaproteobacteria bacterium]|nr:class I SAM-dependent methyltransferase [Deltaproteobacteria bacterium]
MSGHETEFFDRQAESYHSVPAGMRPFHEATARRIESGLAGSVLCIGGLWSRADLSSRGYRLTVMDASAAMLRHYGSEGVLLVQGDACRIGFPDGTFDHVVLPLLLHHVAGSSAISARRNVREVLGGVARVLRPGGSVWIHEFCVPPAVYGVEILSAPFVRWGLALARIPLVVMHTRGFYRSALVESGFHRVEVETVRPLTASPTWIRPVIGLPWLTVPRWIYPARPTLITARL